jgi:BirA family biotin operon repressor/biotin-[acetyl-CoA-carboxylase] ligase
VSLGRHSAYHEVIGSTQDEARRLASDGAPHGFLVWAGEQTAGRGRLDRRWESPPVGLWFSVVLRPGTPAARMAALPLAVGAAVGSALQAHAGGVRMKWPNDVLVDGRKLAGILVEGQVAAGVMDYAVAGVGVNLEHPPGGFPAEISATATALADVSPTTPRRARLLAALLGAIEAEYDELQAHGPGQARERWLELADTIGREVVARAGGEEVRGRAVDLDADGNLVVEGTAGRRVISFGEVEHLR